MVGYGLDITGFDVVNYFSRNMDNVLIGRFWGAGALGLYSRAYNLFMLPIKQIRNPLTFVAIPALCHLQNEPVRYARYYYKFASFIAFVTMPLAGFLFVCSDSVIRLLLGEKWIGASPIFKILAVAAFIQAVETTRGLTLVSLGQSKKYLKMGIFTSIFFVSSFVIGVIWGARGVAMAYTIGEYLIVIPSLWYSFRKTPISVVGFLRVLSRPAINSIIVTVVMFFVYKFILANQPDFIAIGVCLIFGVLLYFGLWLFTPGGVGTIREFFSYILLLGGKKGDQPAIGS
jgi:PST family polysaccharide transporter